MKKPLLTAAVFAATSAACAGGTIDAGENEIDTTDAGVSEYQWIGAVTNSSGVDCPYDAPAEYSGRWEGNLDSSPLSDGSTSIRVDVEGVSVRGLCGTMTFGYESPPPELPVNATDPYAPGLAGDAAFYEKSVVDRFRPLPGFPYEFGRAPAAAGPAYWLPETLDPSADISLDDISLYQPYKAWCNLQTSHAYEDPDTGVITYSCMPPVATGTYYEARSDGCWAGETQLVCTQMTLCTQPTPTCSCSRAGCTSGDVGSGTRPTVHIDGDTMSGTIDLDLDWGLRDLSSFRLTRVQP